MKYIIVSDGILEQAIVFSEGISHRDAYKYHGQIRSAGFCHATVHTDDQWGDRTLRWNCYGMSMSLDMISRGEEDSKILNRQITL
jgi:hypothetical protein